MNNSIDNTDIIKILFDGLWDSEHQRKLKHIGDELDKVRMYANERNTDEDLFSQTMVWLTLSSYYAGLVPITRIEDALFLLKEFRNEYAYALIARAYIEVSARLHKGLSLWRLYKNKKKTLKEFHHGVCRLMAMFRHDRDSPRGLFKDTVGPDGKPIGGFNVQTLIDNLNKDLPEIKNVYASISTYAHGDLASQMINRKRSWVADMTSSVNPVIADYEKSVLQLRELIFLDFNELMAITQQLRNRYDAMHPELSNQ